MKGKWRYIGLVLIIAVWIFLIFCVFPRGSRGEEYNTFLPPQTVAVVYHRGITHFLPSPDPEVITQVLEESKPSWWITTGKWIAGGSAVLASYFYIASLEIPPLHPLFLGAKGGAAALSAVFTGIAAGVGMSVIWVDSTQPKLTWKPAKFYVFSSKRKIEVMKFTPNERLALREEFKGKVRYIFLSQVVLLPPIENLPQGELLEGKVLYWKGRPLLPSVKIKPGRVLEKYTLPLIVY